MDAGATPQFEARPAREPRTRLPDDVPISRDGSLTVPARGPATWYMLAYGSDLRPGQIIERSLHGREIVLYRGHTSGRVFALAAHCTHMGTHLRHGSVEGEQLRCALHNWQFDGQGRCTHATGCDQPPAWARQRSFPVRERHGAIFVHNGPDPQFDVPTWDDFDDDRVIVGHMRPIVIPTLWVAMAVNAWDGVHLQAVHQRVARQPPRVTYPTEWSCRMSWHADVAGTHLADRVTRALARERGVRAHITNHGGMLLLIESWVGKLSPSRLMIGLDPQSDGTTLVRALFPVDRGRIAALSQLRMRIQRRLFHRFLQPDIEILGGMRYRPRTPMAADEPLQPALEFLDSLPAAR